MRRGGPWGREWRYSSGLTRLRPGFGEGRPRVRAVGLAGGREAHLSFSSLVIAGSLRSTGRSLSEPGVRAASGGRTQAGKARGLRCRRPHGSGGEAKAGGAPGLSFWAKTAPESRQRVKHRVTGATRRTTHAGTAPHPPQPTATASHLPHPHSLNVGLPRPPKAPLERAAKEAKLVGRPKGSVGEKRSGQSIGSQLRAGTKTGREEAAQ